MHVCPTDSLVSLVGRVWLGYQRGTVVRVLSVSLEQIVLLAAPRSVKFPAPIPGVLPGETLPRLFPL
jgi:hypothetical protein